MELPEVKMEPIGPRFVALRHEPEKMSEGGIHLPEKATDSQKRVQPEAIVVRLSETLQKDQGDRIKPGDRVLLANSPQQFTSDGRDYLIVDWSMVKGIYHD